MYLLTYLLNPGGYILLCSKALEGIFVDVLKPYREIRQYFDIYLNINK